MKKASGGEPEAKLLARRQKQKHTLWENIVIFTFKTKLNLLFSITLNLIGDSSMFKKLLKKTAKLFAKLPALYLAYNNYGGHNCKYNKILRRVR